VGQTPWDISLYEGRCTDLHSVSASILLKKTNRFVDNLRNALVGGHDPVYAINSGPRIERHSLEIARHNAGWRIGAEKIDRPALLISDDAARAVWIAPRPPHGAVLKHSDRCADGPIDMEDVRENRVVAPRVDDPLPVIVMGERFGGGYECRADHDPLCAELQHLDKVPAIDHAPRSKYRNTGERDQFRQQFP